MRDTPTPPRIAPWLLLLAAAGTFALGLGARQTLGLWGRPPAP